MRLARLSIAAVALGLTLLLAPNATPAGASTAPVAADPEHLPFDFDRAYGRLPKDVVPLDYRIEIVPNVAAKTLEGDETVRLNVRRPETRIEFNSLDETLRDVTFDGAPVRSTMSSNATRLSIVTLARAARPGPHVLHFRYTGKIVQGTPQGLFYQPYVAPGGAKGDMISTQFESTDARRMFPCWDEPSFRASYALSVVIPSAWTATSNMPVASERTNGALKYVRFEPTPKMPSYLVEFTAGDLASIQATSGGKLFRVWAVRGQQNDGAYALANAQQILADYDGYFGYTFPLPKLDSIAIPGGFSGAMENWGAITYNDQALLVTPSSSVGAKQNVYSIQAHEMAHQWNGDLVTMAWWDDLWLNESFASWMSAKETDLRNPSWKWWEDQDRDKEGAMAADGLVTSHPIEVHVTDELQADNAFDPQITYSKGQAFLRMLEAYLGPDTFRDGVRRYIAKRAFSNATSADLWNGLSAASGTDVAALASTWTTRAGFPIVTATARCDASGARTIALTQKRFLIRGTDPNPPHWNVPLAIRSGASGIPQRVLLTTDGQTEPAGRCDEPLSVDADAVGMYRATYDDATLAVDRKQFATLPDGDKIALLDDQWALGNSGQAPLSTYLGLASSMGDDDDTRAWSQIADALGTIERDERGTPGHDAFTAYARGILAPLAARLGDDPKPDETPGTLELRGTVLAELGRFGDEATIAKAKQRFATFLTDRTSLGPDLQAAVLDTVALDADQATFDRLHALTKTAKNQTENERYYFAMMNVRDPALAEQALKIALSDEIPPQEAQLRLYLVFALTNDHPAFAWRSFQADADRLLEPLGTFRPIAVAQYLPAGFWDAAPLDEIEAWAKARLPAEMAPNLARGMESARVRLDEKQTLDTATDAYLRER